jgi:chemotaxis methyl-accepting protein methylase
MSGTCRKTPRSWTALQGTADRRDELFPRSRGWEELRRKKILPALMASRPDGHVLRAWVPGCSTGEEAYSLAMVFKEALEAGSSPRKKITLQIFATDLDKDAIDKARRRLSGKHCRRRLARANEPVLRQG